MNTIHDLLLCLLFLSTPIFLEAQAIEIPFALEDNGHVSINVRVNDSEEAYPFTFDTGASSDLLDLALAKKLGLEADYQQSVAGAGGSKTYDIVLDQKLTLPGSIEIHNTHLVLSDLSNLNESSDHATYGIFGYSLLRNYITMIDYEDQKLRLYNQIEEIDLEGYKKIPFEFHRDIPIPQFDISIKLQNGTTYSGRVFFDSGAGLNLIINSPFNQKHKISQQASRLLSSRMKSLGKQSSPEQMAIQSLKLGDFEFGEMPITIANDQAGVTAYEGYLGILGASIIKRFTVITDYQTKTIYLKPNSLFDNAFDFPLSGLHLIRRNGKIIIDHVEPSSAAYQKGIRPEYELLAIDDDHSGKVDQYRRLLRAAEGQMRKLKVRKPDGQIHTFNIQLRRLL